MQGCAMSAVSRQWTAGGVQSIRRSQPSVIETGIAALTAPRSKRRSTRGIALRVRGGGRKMNSMKHKRQPAVHCTRLLGDHPSVRIATMLNNMDLLTRKQIRAAVETGRLDRKSV